MEIDRAIERLVRHIGDLHDQRVRPYYLLVDDRYRGIESSGNGRHYGFPPQVRGADLSEQLLFLVGQEDIDKPSLRLPYLEVGGNYGVTAQVHALRLKGGWGVAFVDASEEKRQLLTLQQKAHEVELLRADQQKLLGQVQQAHDELAEKNRALDKANALKSRFIARMSHEFRTPLSSIMGFSELAHEDMDDHTRLHGDLQAIGRSAHYLLNLVENLLDHAVAENHELALRPGACDLSVLVAGLEELFQPMARQRDLMLTWWLGAGLPPRVWLDEMRLRQVMVNLIGNAIKYTQQGAVTVSLDWSDDQVQLDVEDTGPGIAEREVESLFEPFNRGGGGGGQARGAGLGLSITREIVQRMGGTINIESQPGKGTHVQCKMPAAARARLGGGQLQHLEGEKVVLVEPDQDNRRLLDIYLRGAGCEVFQADDAAECQALAVTHSPALVLVALEDDERVNTAIPQQLLEQGFSGQLIALGAREARDSLQAVLDSGYADLITRPVRREHLLRQLAVDLDRLGSL